MKINETEIEVVRGGVLESDAQAIVNAANTAMRGGGGVDGAIHDAAGKELMAELMEVAPHGAETSVPVLTRGHNLKQEYVIHVAGPVWSEARAGECEKLLHSCYRGALEMADEKELASLAFCSISTGIYGYPLALAAPVAVKTIVEYLWEHPQTGLRRVLFAMFGKEEYEVFCSALKKSQLS